LRAGAEAVRLALEDRDPLVRAAALASLGAVGCSDEDVVSVEKAFTESAWQIRQGAARALAGAAPEVAVPTLSRALEDQHLDVRKAAVLSLSRWAASESTARQALTVALDDSDADVRAYARQALAG
jgi:HEAT repeat protein